MREIAHKAVQVVPGVGNTPHHKQKKEVSHPAQGIAGVGILCLYIKGCGDRDEHIAALVVVEAVFRTHQDDHSDKNCGQPQIEDCPYQILSVEFLLHPSVPITPVSHPSVPVARVYYSARSSKSGSGASRSSGP